MEQRHPFDLHGPDVHSEHDDDAAWRNQVDRASKALLRTGGFDHDLVGALGPDLRAQSLAGLALVRMTRFDSDIFHTHAPRACHREQAERARAHHGHARVGAALAQAQLNLERTVVKAPSRGVVSRKSVEPGQVVQPGQPLLALVTLGDVWVVANFKETQLASMRVGQRATVDVDALGGREFTGKVDSIAAATGAKFSLLPPENASGNYVKVVQRVPVKIVFDTGQDPEHLLRPGMSVGPTVFTK